MLIRCGLLVVFTVMRGLLIRVWSITLILEHLFVVFLFLEVAKSDTFGSFFCWHPSRFPLWTTWGSGVFVATPLPWVTNALLLGTYLVFPGLHFFRFIRFGYFSVGSAPSYRGIFGHACLSCPCCSWAIFMSTFRSLPGTLVRISPCWVDTFQRDTPMTSQTNYYLVL